MVVLEISGLEALHLAGIVGQFRDVVTDTQRSDDPAVARLLPDAYPDDEEATREFRRLTGDDLLGRRAADAEVVLRTLGMDGGAHDQGDPDATLTIALGEDEALSWMRTLSAVRLVMATRLGILSEDDHQPDDPRFGIYDWIGYRLDGLVTALNRR
ncbi:hypothetical protein RSA3_11200 [Microbacterium testaceum]|uniref:Uncharacterized protein n=1 Tax=Microbacterium testaceum TaxID=2033 RepID=A0A147F6M4_MICTE|nr:hypothetical protein NS283_06615 [Microbacterium testaceum]KTS10881.1 hypothetical protein RSA3_11200 [Microbacterium testaceum]KTS90556.1 hypothetical protein NS183_08485 [Microbacterium testaceum]